MPAPPSHAEAMRRVNDGLPQGLAVAYRPRGPGGRAALPFRVLVEGRQVHASASLVGAVFVALRHVNDVRFSQPALPFGGPTTNIREAHHG